MDKIDKLLLLAGDPIPFGPLFVYQPILKDIKNLGYIIFNRITNLLTITDIELELYYEKNKENFKTTDPLEYLFLKSLEDPMFFLELRIGFFTYLKEEVFLDLENKTFKFLISEPEKSNLKVNKLIKDKWFFSLKKEDFSKLQNIIKIINKIEDEEEPEIITDNLEMKKKFQEARRKLRLAKEKERLLKAQKNEGIKISIPEIISSVCILGTGYTLTNIWDLTIYQLYDQWRRCQMKEDYGIGIDMLLAGASKKDVNLQYWMKEI